MRRIIAIAVTVMLLLSCNALAADTSIKALNENQEEISVIETGKITFQSEIPQNAALIVAVYDENDSIVDFSFAEKSDNEQQTVLLSVQVNADERTNKIIAMLWDGFDTMNPICDELELK